MPDSLTSTLRTKRVHLTEKTTLCALRGVVFLLFVFFVLYNPSLEKEFSSGPFILLMLYLISDVFLFKISESTFYKPIVQATIFLFDIGVISGMIYASAGFDSDLYLIYFVVVLMSGLQMRIWQSFLIGLTSCVIYIALWTKANPEASFFDTHLLLRLPFFYIVACFTAFFAHHAKQQEEQHRETLLAQEKAKLETVFREMTNAAILTNQQGKILLSNHVASKIFSVGDSLSSSLAQGLQGVQMQPSILEILASHQTNVPFEAIREHPKNDHGRDRDLAEIRGHNLRPKVGRPLVHL